jgi:hypothetical protein
MTARDLAIIAAVCTFFAFALWMVATAKGPFVRETIGGIAIGDRRP